MEVGLIGEPLASVNPGTITTGIRCSEIASSWMIGESQRFAETPGMAMTSAPDIGRLGVLAKMTRSAVCRVCPPPWMRVISDVEAPANGPRAGIRTASNSGLTSILDAGIDAIRFRM